MGSRHAPPPRPLAVLVVESDALTRVTIVYMLEALQYKVHAVDSVAAAHGLLASVRFDVAVLSLGRSDPDGEPLAAEIKALQGHLRLIVLSGRSVPGKTTPSIDAFVPKPFSLKAVDEAIRGLQLGAPAPRLRGGTLH